MNLLKYYIKKKHGFTLVEILIAAGVFSLFIIFIMVINGHSNRGMSRVIWHNNINRQGNAMGRRLHDLFLKSSAPAVVTDNGTLLSTSQEHCLKVSSGNLLTPDGSRKVIITIPRSIVSTDSVQGRVIWTELSIEPDYPGTGNVFYSEAVTPYTKSNYNQVTINSGSFSNSTKRLLLEDVASIKLEKEGDQVLRIIFNCQNPKDHKQKQKFQFDGRTDLSIVGL